MIKKFKKGIALALASAMIFSSLSPVFATVDEKQTTSTSETLATDVLYNQDSTFTVTVPKKVTLEEDKTSTYEVIVEGDIASNEVVNVVPEEEFLMKDQATTGTKKADVTATVKQDKTTWTFNEFATLGNGNIEAQNLTSGSWKGTFWFNISLELLHVHSYGTVTYTWSGYTSCTAKRTCTTCENVETEDAIVTSTITKEPTCTKVGAKTNTAKFTNTAFETQTKLQGITATGHDYVNRICTKCSDVQEAGLYTAKDEMICSWEESGINVSTNYSIFESDSNYYRNYNTSAYNVLLEYGNTKKIVVPEGITRISNVAFAICYDLTDIYLPEGLTSIGEWAFASCTSLKNINIPESVTSIADYAFQDTSIETITIPNNVTSVNASTFYGCKKLASVTLPENLKRINYGAFEGCVKLNNVTYKGVTYNSLSELTTALTDNGVTIGNKAFDSTGLAD